MDEYAWTPIRQGFPYAVLSIVLVLVGDLSFASSCVLAVEGSLVFGANAICRYFSYKSTSCCDARDPKSAAAAEQWLEWEARVLASLEKTITQEKKGADLPPEALAPFQYLEERLTTQWLLEGVRLA